MKEILIKAYEAMENAYAPYSNYRVGACVKLADGEFIPGTNVENAAYGSSMCAERNGIWRVFPGISEGRYRRAGDCQ